MIHQSILLGPIQGAIESENRGIMGSIDRGLGSQVQGFIEVRGFVLINYQL